MRTVSAWADTAPVDRDKLAKILRCDPDAEIVDRAQAAITRGASYLVPEATSTNVDALRKETDSLLNSLEKMRGSLRFMEGADHFLDEEIAIMHGDTSLMELRQQTESASSGFAVMVDRMAEAVKAFKQESLGKSRKGKNPDGSHTLAISELIRFANAEGITVTDSRGSTFPRLVALAFFDPYSTPSAAIRRAIAATN